MIWPRGRMRVCAAPTDLRKGYMGLSALVMSEMGHDLLEGDLFVFVSKHRKSVKILRWDGTGLCLYCKRISRGRFAAVWRRAAGEVVAISRADLLLFLDGHKRAP